ncbi:hypothetical protein ACFUCH_12045 [Streptomyces olivaceus]|uniref:hypothetical protein n=1 Tax=Streptomyces olivaceus TaxID=47716 RepID=UPI003643DE94
MAALLTDPALLGEPAAWPTQLAGTDEDAAAAASCLLDATTALPAAERPPAWHGLRRALANAGDIAAARHQ